MSEEGWRGHSVNIHRQIGRRSRLVLRSKKGEHAVNNGNEVSSFSSCYHSIKR